MANKKGHIHRKGTEESLDAVGKIQAKKLIEVCKQNHIEAVFSSPEKRAMETAEIITSGMNLPKPQILENLHERDWGDWEGKPWEEVKQKLESMSLDDRYTFVPPNGESWQQMEQRLQKAVNDIVDSRYKSVAIVTHGGALRGLMPILKDTPKESSFQYDFNNASVTIFNYQKGKFTEVLINNIGHL